jgi:hypothetical protein
MTTEPPSRIYIRRDQMQNPSGVWSANDLRDVVPAIEYVRLPPAHVIVPVEPTKEMIYSALVALDYTKPVDDVVKKIYHGMIAAAAQKPEK